MTGLASAKIERLDAVFECDEHGPWTTEIVLTGPVSGDGPWAVSERGLRNCVQCGRPGTPTAEARREARAYNLRLLDRRALEGDLERAVEALADTTDGIILPMHRLALAGTAAVVGVDLSSEEHVRVTLQWERADG